MRRCSRAVIVVNPVHLSLKQVRDDIFMGPAIGFHSVIVATSARLAIRTGSLVR